MVLCMLKRLLIDLSMLPEEGKAYRGELSEEIFELPAGDDVQAAGPLSYDLFVQRFETELLISGEISAPFRMVCVRTIHPFVQTIVVEGMAVSLEIGSEGEMDITDALREEVLVLLPHDPRCSEADEEMTCEIDSRYLAVDKEDDFSVEDAPRAGTTDDRWSVLDALHPKQETL